MVGGGSDGTGGARPYDEAHADDGAPRPHYAPLLAALEGPDLAGLARRLGQRAAADGVRYGAGEAAHPFVVDPVPRLLTAAEWARLDAGLRQRVRALEAFVADAYGPRAAVAAGVVPADLLPTAAHHLPELRAIPAPAVWIGIAGLDVVRGPDGGFAVLEDNVRTPTLMAYAAWARRAVGELHPALPAPRPVEAALRELLLGALRAAAPERSEPHAVVLGDPGSDSDWEARALARLAGLPLVRLGELAHRGDRLVTRADGRAVDVVYRRDPEDRLRDEAGRLTGVGEALLGPLRAGTLRVVNAFGTGIADDKRTHAYVEDLVRFFCGEAPVLPSVPTLDLAAPSARAAALTRLDELVFKPRAGAGGHGVVLGPRATPEERERLRAAVEAEPAGWVAQELVLLSTHPTVIEGRLEPRHVDLRPFVFAGPDGPAVLPGGLSRFALAPGEIVVNAAQGGGGKDTWVLE